MGCEDYYVDDYWSCSTAEFKDKYELDPDIKFLEKQIKKIEESNSSNFITSFMTYLKNFFK